MGLGQASLLDNQGQPKERSMARPKTKLQDLQERLAKGGKFNAKLVLKELSAMNDSWEVCALKAMCYQELGDPSEMAHWFYLAWDKSKQPRFLAAHATALLNLAQSKEEALRILTKMIDERLPIKEPYQTMAKYHWNEGSAQSALDTLQVALEMPELRADTDLLLMYAYTYLVLGQTDAAREMTLKAVRLVLNKPKLSSFADLTYDAASKIVLGRHLWERFEDDGNAFLNAVKDWVREDQLIEEQSLIACNDELLGRIRDVIHIDWSKITPDMWTTSEQFEEDLLARAKRNAELLRSE